MEKNSNIDLDKIWQESAKKYNLKKKDYWLWTVKDELIFGIYSHYTMIEKQYYLKVVCEFKPKWSDEIYWNIMINSKLIPNLEKEPLSYRITGSYIAPMKGIYSNQVELSGLDSEDEIQTKHDNEIEKILEIIRNISKKEYTGRADFDVITAIYNYDYRNARQILKEIPNPYNLNGTLKKSGTDLKIWLFRRAAKRYIRFRGLLFKKRENLSLESNNIKKMLLWRSYNI